jgi:hypothetical protein
MRNKNELNAVKLHDPAILLKGSIEMIRELACEGRTPLDAITMLSLL